MMRIPNRDYARLVRQSKEWLLYVSIMALLGASLFVFVSTVTSGDTGVTPYYMVESEDYHGKEGGYGDFWSVKCSGSACVAKPDPGRNR